MADDSTPEGRPDDFFSELPMFGDLAKALQNQGPLNWDAARQFAQLGATGGTPEPNVDPAARLSFADLDPHRLVPRRRRDRHRTPRRRSRRS